MVGWYAGADEGLLDRALLPGFAFRMVEGEEVPAKLLKGRSARVLITSDTAAHYYDELYERAHDKVMSRQILEFVGFEEHSLHLFSPVFSASEEERTAWLAEAAQLGEQDALAQKDVMAA